MFGELRQKLATVAGMAVVAWLAGGVHAAAQGHCTINQLAGTYAFESHGSLTSALAPAAPFDWAWSGRPFVMVGTFSVGPDTSMSGEAWVVLGRVSSGLTARPIAGQLVELDEEACTAVLEWSGSPIPGGTPGFHRERLVFANNGREFRSMLLQSPSGGMAWVGRGHRITLAPASVGACDPGWLKGDVLLQCEGVGVAGAAASSAFLALLRVAADGSFSGISYAKDPAYSERPVQGALTVWPNCMVDASLQSPLLPGIVHQGRGMLLGPGGGGFLMMPLETTLPDGSTARPAFARCDLLPLGR